MHEASPYGHLVLGGLAVSNDVLARMSGLGADECGALLSELESAGVFSRTRKGVIYSRRLVKDRSRSEKGRKSVNKRWAQGAENLREKPQPNRCPNRGPITQKPEARERKKDKPSSLSERGKPLSARAIPDWLPLAEWDGFMAMRTKTKKPLTDRAASMAIRKLGELRDKGEDPAAVLDQSTLHCWQDLYPVSERKAQTYDRDRITV
ncbi:MAG TPA: hypothetical protein VJ775_01465 [Sphingomicrobium sp.]|nr:hypothetical protein [Sphingomicrobium sp.]